MSSSPHYERETISIKDKNDGKVPAKNLSIVWGRDSRYWKLPKTEEEPAELLQVCWLEVTGSVDTNPKKSYEVGFKLSLTPDAFGWTREYCPLSVMTKRGKNGNALWKRTSIDGNKPSTEFEITGKLVKAPQDEKDTKLYFGLYEIWGGKWKGGLKIHQAFVREKK